MTPARTGLDGIHNGARTVQRRGDCRRAGAFRVVETLFKLQTPQGCADSVAPVRHVLPRERSFSTTTSDITFNRAGNSPSVSSRTRRPAGKRRGPAKIRKWLAPSLRAKLATRKRPIRRPTPASKHDWDFARAGSGNGPSSCFLTFLASLWIVAGAPAAIVPTLPYSQQAVVLFGR
jgi:hypothetical protein